MICKRCQKKKSHQDFSTYKHGSSGKVVKLKTCKECLKNNRRGGCKPILKSGVKRECHCCKNSFISVSKYNILCEDCKQIEQDTLYSVVF